ncbi:MAG: hypothetical protein Q8R37_05395 [Nanoarchaeota archaeon]|nr:hypothetical protein [Nanoarchaeota archaeon]
MTEKTTLDLLETVSLGGAALGIFASGLYYGFSNGIGVEVDPLETTLLVMGSPLLNATLYTYLAKRNSSQKNSPISQLSKDTLEDALASKSSLPQGMVPGAAAGLIFVGLSYSFGYFIGKISSSN